MAEGVDKKEEETLTIRVKDQVQATQRFIFILFGSSLSLSFFFPFFGAQLDPTNLFFLLFEKFLGRMEKKHFLK